MNVKTICLFPEPDSDPPSSTNVFLGANAKRQMVRHTVMVWADGMFIVEANDIYVAYGTLQGKRINFDSSSLTPKAAAKLRNVLSGL